MGATLSFPRQALPFSQKTKAWRRSVLDWADGKTFTHYSPVRRSTIHKKVNYDLVNGVIHMDDVLAVLNPEGLKDRTIPKQIQHYPIINSKLNILRGEESKRSFDFRVVLTNPTAVGEKEETLRGLVMERMMAVMQDRGLDEEEVQRRAQEIQEFATYEWQDYREIRANALLQHYSREQDFPLTFNDGFFDALVCAEEMYICDIVGGEPTLERLNPLKVRAFRNGYSNRIEDADVIIIEDYWSPGRVIDTYFDDTENKKLVEYIEKMPDNIGQAYSDSMDNIDERAGFVNMNMISDVFAPDGGRVDVNMLFGHEYESYMPYDAAGNIRVLKVFWKSRRKLRKIKSYDPETGEETFDFYPENYIPDRDAGEESTTYWVNEAWEGVKIGDGIYVNMRPRLVQFNTLSNPSRCHFGIVGTIYNINQSKPFSMVDMMKPYSYLYDIIYDRLRAMIARNWGKLVKVDTATVPSGWDMDKWLYFARMSGIAVTDSFKEGNVGAATGKLAGAMNNNSSGYIDADWGQYIQQYIALLEQIKTEMGDACGINRQREGQVYNRETVGGVERANLQSSHITEWLFMQHEDLKKRVYECFLEVAKAAIRGGSRKFDYILPGYAKEIVTIDGDQFCECDYGLVVDNSQGTQLLAQQIEQLAQAALQTQALNFSTIMKLYSTASISEKIRMVERGEAQRQEEMQKQQEAQQQMQQQMIEAQQQQQQMQMQFTEGINQRDNETRMAVAQIQAQARIDAERLYAEAKFAADAAPAPMGEADRARLDEKIREFDIDHDLKERKQDLEEEKVRTTLETQSDWTDADRRSKEFMQDLEKRRQEFSERMQQRQQSFDEQMERSRLALDRRALGLKGDAEKGKGKGKK